MKQLANYLERNNYDYSHEKGFSHYFDNVIIEIDALNIFFDTTENPEDHRKIRKLTHYCERYDYVLKTMSSCSGRIWMQATTVSKAIEMDVYNYYRSASVASFEKLHHKYYNFALKHPHHFNHRIQQVTRIYELRLAKELKSIASL